MMCAGVELGASLTSVEVVEITLLLCATASAETDDELAVFEHDRESALDHTARLAPRRQADFAVIGPHFEVARADQGCSISLWHRSPRG